MSKKTTKRSLLASVLALALCVIMLVGTTFAWFTDTASTSVNKIQAGKLKMKVEYSADMVNWNEVSADKTVFDENALWEPGRTEVVYFRVSNVGNLALRYNFNAKVSSYSPGINADGDEIHLGDYLMFGSADTAAAFSTREDAIAAVAGNAQLIEQKNIAVKNSEVVLPEQSSAVFALVMYMPATVGNEANNVDGRRTPGIKVGITINATQATVENDSFDNTYDADAPKNFNRVEYYSGTHTVDESVMAPGGWGTIAVNGGTTTVNAGVTSIYQRDAAVAVWASANWSGSVKGHVIINKGVFSQVDVPDGESCDLIYADKGATIEINGGTFKAADPQWTLNCKDGSGSTITVKGGTFYKFDPSNANVGTGEIIVPTGYHVVQNGDWYTVVEGEIVNSNEEFNTALANIAENDKIILACNITELTVPVDSIPNGLTIDGQGEYGLVRDVYNALASLSTITIQDVAFLG